MNKVKKQESEYHLFQVALYQQMTGEKVKISNSNIFDLSTTDDLPPELGVRKEYAKDRFSGRLVALLKEAGTEVTVEQLTAAYYRRYGEIKTRKQVNMKICHMSHNDRNVGKVPGMSATYKYVGE